MTTPDTDDQPTGADIAEFLDMLASEAQRAAEAGVPPEAMAEGTFAMYPAPEGGMVLVMAIDRGPMAGEKRLRIRPGMMRAVLALAGGGSKLDTLRGMTGLGRRRKGLGDGRG